MPQEIEKPRPLANQIDAHCKDSQAKVDELAQCVTKIRAMQGDDGGARDVHARVYSWLIERRVAHVGALCSV